jgi:tetratricopeptide (TPR) repeat protein
VLSKSEVKRYRATMAEAVRAAKKGKHAAAIAAYDRALAIKPNDQSALTDQGWSAFLLGLLDRAESITRRALAVNGTSRREAAGYYNLGRILEQRGDKPAAVAAYVQSLEWRPTRTVREQLAKLDLPGPDSCRPC